MYIAGDHGGASKRLCSPNCKICKGEPFGTLWYTSPVYVWFLSLALGVPFSKNLLRTLESFMCMHREPLTSNFASPEEFLLIHIITGY